MGALAQSLAPREMQRLRGRVIQTLNNLEYLSNYVKSDSEYPDSIIALFSSPEAMICVDLLGLSDSKNVPVKDYVKLLEKKYTEAKFKNYQLEDSIRHADGRYLIDASFTKSVISHYDVSAGLVINSQEYFDSLDYKLTAHMAYDPRTRKITIESITGKVPTEKPWLDTHFGALKLSNHRDSKLQIENQPVKFNEGGYALYPEVALFYGLEYPQVDVKAKVRETSYGSHIYTTHYYTRKWVVRPHVDFSIGEYYKIEALKYNTQASNSSALEFGLDLGYSVPTYSNFKFTLYTGAAISTSHVNLNIKDANFFYNTDQDEDGDTYQRHYENVSAQQHFDFTDLVIPAYLSLEMQFGKVMSVFADLGVKCYLDMSQKTRAEGAQFKVYGVFPKYDNVVIQGGNTLNGFTDHGTISADNAQDMERRKFTMDAIGRLGLRFHIWGPLSLDVSAGYQRSILNCYPVTKDMYAIDYTLAGGEVANLSAGVFKIWRQALTLRGALTLKF